MNVEPQTASAVTLVSTVSSETSNPREESFSIFSDSSCGEPLVAQHLQIDFTPLNEDTDFLQRKCCAFWEFVQNCPELQDMEVLPEKDALPQFDYDSTTSSSTSATSASISCERTALSMLEIVEKKGVIDRIFGARMAQSGCSLGSREYPETTPLHTDPVKVKPVRTCTDSCTLCAKRGSDVTDPPPGPPAPPATRDMCRMLEEWDKHHPKSMEPPTHQPALSHCVMQRNIPF